VANMIASTSAVCTRKLSHAEPRRARKEGCSRALQARQLFEAAVVADWGASPTLAFRRSGFKVPVIA
jgi:hypothetical protein